MQTLFVTSSLLLWALVLLNLALTIALARRLNEGLRAASPGLAQLATGEAPPPFAAHSLDGEERTLESFRGRPAAFVFVAPDCNGCREVPPMLQELSAEARVSGLELVLVSTSGEAETRVFLEGMEIDLPVLVAPRQSNPFYADWRVPGTPFYVFVDSEGKVQNSNFFGKEYFRQEWRVLEVKGLFGPSGGPQTSSHDAKGGAAADESSLKPVFHGLS